MAQLTNDQQQSLFDRIKRPCHICGSDDWAITDELMALSVYPTDSRSRTQKNLPVAAIMCNKCKQLTLFSAYAAGLFPSSE